MKNLIIVLSLMTSLILSGQNIVPIPANNSSQWRIQRGYLFGSCIDWYNSIYYVDGTIEHNGNIFYKIFETGEFYQEVFDPVVPCDNTYSYNAIFRGAIRTENGKTYRLLNNEEHLLMDFTLNVGDTHVSSICDGLVIDSIDEVLVGTEYRKRFNFSNGSICHWMIEGVGHQAGLFEPMTTILEFASFFHCYGENNITLYGDTNCNLNLGIEDLSTQNYKVVIFPNPSSAKFTIDISQLTNTIESYSITDIYGKILFENNMNHVNNNVFEIDLNKYSSGLYFLRLDFENQGIGYRKIIKE